MLAPADACLARRDPAVPGIALVLDPGALADGLRRTGAFGDLVSARATYVRYKPGTSCLVGYHLERPEGGMTACAKAFRHGDGPKLAKARIKAGPGTVVTFDTELVTVLGVAGDRDLPVARRLARPDARRRLLQSLLPGAPDLWDATPRCLRYKPERRWVGVVPSVGPPVALIKGYSGTDLASACAGLDFATRSELRSPELLGTSTRAQALASSWVPGEALGDVLAGDRGDAGRVVDAGAALSALHRQPGARLELAPPGGDAAAVVAAAFGVAAVMPDLGPRAIELAGALRPRLLTGAAVPGPRHGDFSPDQVVVGAGGAAIVDFDNAAVGDAAADLGQFLATLDVAALDGALPAGTLPSLGAEFLAAYESAGGPADLNRVALHRGAALLRLALEPFRNRQPEWPARTAELLDRASALAVPAAAPI